MRRTFRGVAAIVLAATVLLTGCGSGATSSTAGGPATGATSSAGYSPDQVRGFRECLRAHGVRHLLPAEAMTGTPTAGPSGMSTPDAGGGPIGFRPGIRFANPRIAKALHFCRITLPSVAPSS